MPATVPPSRLKAVCRALASVLGMAAVAASVLLLSAVPRVDDSEWPLVLWLVVMLPATVVIHEAGHAIAAVLAGSHLVGVQIGPLLFTRRRRGVRLRWSRTRERLAGMAFAIPDFTGNVRRQLLMFTAGGPAANLLTASACLVCLRAVQVPSLTATVAAAGAFAILNAMIGLVNLLPVGKHHASDGSLLACWWKGGGATLEALRVLRMYEQSLTGVLASELPRSRIDELEASASAGVRLFGNYLALRAAQQRRDDAEFDAVFVRAKAGMQALDAAGYAALRPLWAYFLAERMFEGCLAGTGPEPEFDVELQQGLAVVILRRIEATQARLSADADRFQRAIRRARRESEGTFDRATRRAEAALLDRLEAMPVSMLHHSSPQR